MRYIFLALITFSGMVSILGQSKISGMIKDESGEALAFADIKLLAMDTITVLHHTQSEANGTFFYISPNKSYFVLVEYVGYEVYKMKMSASSKDSTLTILLSNQKEKLDQVDVVAKKMSIERKIDRWVMDIKNDITASGSSVLQVLAKSPGVMINQQNGSVSMAGKEDVKIMINGKIQYLQANAVVDFLAAMSANKVEKIELITQPPSSQDAEGNAGMINIILKQSQDEGYNGDAAIAIGGYKGYQNTADVNLQVFKSALSIYGNISYLKNTQSQEFNFFRDIHKDGGLYNTNVNQERYPTKTNISTMIGIDYTKGKNKIGIALNGYHNTWDMHSDHKSVTVLRSSLTDSTATQATEINKWRHFGINAQYTYQIADGKALSFSGDYLDYYTSNPSNYANSYYDSHASLTNTDQSKIEKITPIQIKVARVDYTQNGKKVSTESGLKWVQSTLDNQVTTSMYSNNLWTINPHYTNRANLYEQILAAYHSVQWAINEKTTVKGGIRYEHTVTTIANEEKVNLVDRKLSNFFPTLFISHQLSSSSSLGLSYASRINRPTFNDLAPFIFFNDPNSLVTGNTNLLPSTSHTIKAEYKKNSLILFTQYSVENNPLAKFSPTYVDSLSATIYQTKNYKTNKTWATTISLPMDITNKWQLMVNASFNYQQLRGAINQKAFTINNPYFSIMANNTFNIGHRMNVECSGMYNSSGFIGGYILKPFGFVNLGWRYKISDRSVIHLNGQNILNTMAFRFSFHDVNTEDDFSLKMYFGRPTIMLSYKYSFGNNKLKNSNNFNAGEERKRVE